MHSCFISDSVCLLQITPDSEAFEDMALTKVGSVSSLLVTYSFIGLGQRELGVFWSPGQPWLAEYGRGRLWFPLLSSTSTWCVLTLSCWCNCILIEQEIPGLLHFVYRSHNTSQMVAPHPSAPYHTVEEQRRSTFPIPPTQYLIDRLFRLYERVVARVKLLDNDHNKPHKVQRVNFLWISRA